MNGRLGRTRESLSERAEAVVLAAMLVGGALAVAVGALEWRSALPLAVGAGIAGYLPRRSLSDAAVLALPLLAAQAIEWGVAPGVLACLVLPVYAVTTRARFALFTGTGLLAFLLAAIALKTRFAGTRLTWQDIKFFFLQFHDNAAVMASQPTLLVYAGGAVAVLFAWCASGWLLDRRAPRGSSVTRSVLAVSLSIGLVVASATNLVRDVSQLRSANAWNFGLAMNPHADPLLPFLATAGLEPHWAPQGVDDGPLRAAAARLAAGAGHAARPADIVVFLQESQFNPRSIGGCSAALCDVDAFQPRDGTRAQGPLRVHVFGGGTWLTEFAFATGVPHDAFGSAGDFAPFNVAPGVRSSFVRSLRHSGYRTVALYPVRGGMMNARAAYAGYGFDRFLDSDDLGLTGRFDTQDQELHRAALRVLEEERKLGQPVFVMVVTIFNHGEHGVRMDRVPHELLERARADFPEPDEARNVADYLWRTQQFSRTLQGTRQQLLASEQPTVLAWFGDHQPPFAGAPGLRGKIRSLDETTARVPPRYQTWFQIASNLPAGPAPVAASPLDIVFLPGLIAQLAGVPLDSWLGANIVSREACAGLLTECTTPLSAGAYLTFLHKELGYGPE